MDDGASSGLPVIGATVGLLAFAVNVFVNLKRVTAHRPWAAAPRRSDGAPLPDLA